MTEESREDRTERLRELFVDVTGDTTVTEQQEPSPTVLGTQHDSDATLRETIQEMCEEYGIQTSLTVDELATVVRLFYDERSDTAIARELGDSSRDRTIARARINLQLFRETDFEAPFDLTHLREMMTNDLPTTSIAEQFNVSETTVRSYRRLLEQEREAIATDYAYPTRFQEILADDEFDDREPDPTLRYDGLSDAIEGADATG